MNGLFDSPGTEWQRVSPALATIRRLLTVPLLLALAIVCIVLGILINVWISLLAIGFLAAAGGVWIWAGRNQRSWGYVENQDDLVITSGVMFKRLVAIPYGRMQFVDVSAGPVARKFRVATVTLHTASSETAANLPGIDQAEATRLRNRLTELGEAHGAGL